MPVVKVWMPKWLATPKSARVSISTSAARRHSRARQRLGPRRGCGRAAAPRQASGLHGGRRALANQNVRQQAP